MLLSRFVNKKNKVVEGKKIKFSMTCDKCGGNAQITPVSFYQYGHNMHPTEIDLEIKCTNCSNQFTAVIHKNERKSQ